jgi:hypothetical protein
MMWIAAGYPQDEADNIALVDAVHASSNAPVTFFDAPAIVSHPNAPAGDPPRRYLDGAMGGYNNPLMAGVVDAICLGVDPIDIHVLSIGTGTVRLAPADLAAPGANPNLLAPLVKPSIFGDAGRAAGCITDDPPDTATYTAHVVLRNDPSVVGRVVRLNAVVQPVLTNGVWTYPPGIPQAVFDPLAKLSMDAVEAGDVDLIKTLGVAWIAGGARNQPIRMTDDLKCALDDETYGAGKLRWQELAQ